MRNERSIPSDAVPPGSPSPASDRKVEEALSALHRCVASYQFHPPGHPSLLEAVEDGFRTWCGIDGDRRLADAGLRFESGGLSIAEDPVGRENPAVLALSRTFRDHGVARLVRRDALSEEGFALLVSLLAKGPDELGSTEGLVGTWKNSGHSSSLEFQVLAAPPAETGPDQADLREPQDQDWGAGLSESGLMASLSDPMLLARFKTFQERGPRARLVLDLLLQLHRADDASCFLDLLASITRATQEYVGEEDFPEALSIVLFLYRESQNMGALGQEGKRDHLLDAVRLMLQGSFLQWLIAVVTSARSNEEAEVGEYLLRALGKTAVVPMIHALVEEKDWKGRQRLLDVLVSIGRPVVPFAVKLLDDPRWYVARNMITLLGGVGDPEGVRAVVRLSKDPDSRVRAEVARSLARVAASEAESILVSLLKDPDPSVRLSAVWAAAGHPSQVVLEALLRVFEEVGVESSDWNLKTSLIQALGRLGMPEAIPFMEAVLRKRPVFRRKRWEVIQVAVAQVMGDLGGPRAQEVLGGLASHWSPQVRGAAARALAGMGRPVEEVAP